MSATDFEENDDLDGLSSEELEEQAFGPDPTRRRRRSRRARWRRRQRKETAPTEAVQVVERTPASQPPDIVVTKFCYACGVEVDARAVVCPRCGVRQPEVPSRGGRVKPRRKGTATLLALLLGGVGAHRFYLGQPKIGVAMLLFFWTMIPALVGVVDFVRYVFMSDRRFADLYDGGSTQALLATARPASLYGHVSAPREVATVASVAPSEASELAS